MTIFNILKPALYRLSPESAHHLAIAALQWGMVPSIPAVHAESLRSTVWGIDFANPVGMGAGFDKNAVALHGLARQGFGFVEVGTVTPRPQVGNPKPRLFRLTEDEAVINRMGFNNAGMEPFIRGLGNRPAGVVVGANIGKNKDSSDAVADYLTLLQAVYGLSDYITVNISSPNTPGLRDLQHKSELDGLLAELMKQKAALQKKTGKNIPLLLKLAPDTSYEQREDMASVVMKHRIDGLIISNTTIGLRDNLKSADAGQTGGLSGKPLMALSTQMVKDMYRLTEKSIPIIGVGGIASAEDAYAKIRAGASLVQVYSALVFQGFGLVQQINERLVELLARDGFANVAEAVGVDA